MAKKQIETETETETPETKDGKAAAKGPVPVHIGGDTILDRLLPHVKKIAVGALVVAVILLAVFGYRWYKDRNRASATTQLARALDLLQREVKKPDPDEKPDPSVKAPPSYPSYKDRAVATVAELDRGAMVVTEPFRAGLLLDAGRLDDAEAAYRRGSTRKDLEGVLAREGLGFVAEARAHAAKDAGERQKHLEAALAAFRAAQPDDAGPHRDHALYHEGRILALLDKKPEAVAALEKALEVVPETELESAINDRLAQLEEHK